MLQRIARIAKKDPVLAASFGLAVLSMFRVHPSGDYLGYLDLRVLGILLSLMLVMAGFQKNGFFEMLGSSLLRRSRGIRQLSLVLTFLCFFSSMLITNDVALITFVPFAVLILQKMKRADLMIPVIVSQTLAANLGSMLTPLGNPQNLYLYNLLGISVGAFLRRMIPYTAAAGILLFLLQFWIGAAAGGGTEPVSVQPQGVATVKSVFRHFWKNGIYGLLFVLCLLVVFHVLPYYIVLAVIAAVILVLDRDLLIAVDYSLLLTFTFFFVFTGNLRNIEPVKEALQSLVASREVWIGILASQGISNVPAALLLSGFSEDLPALLVGVNLGGLGTLIASMASLISYKLYAGTEGARKGKYLLVFTVWNLFFLGILILVHLAVR